MIGALRAIRAIFGVAFWYQVFGIFSILSIAATGTMSIYKEPWAFLLLKLIWMAVFGAIFFGLRALINRIHTKRHGEPHPALAKAWAL